MLGITYIKYLAYFKELPETIDTDTLVQYHKMTMDDFRKQMKFDGKWFNNRKLKQIERFIDQPGYSYYGIYDGDNLICYGAISTNHDNFININLPVYLNQHGIVIKFSLIFFYDIKCTFLFRFCGRFIIYQSSQ